jgi:phosphate-selective porin
LRAEYTYATDDRLGQGLAGEDLPDARYRAWYVSGTFLVTGERKARPVVPRHELFRGGIGAIEVAGRYERIHFDSVGGRDIAFRNPRAETILPSGDRVMTIGANWFVNRWITVQVNAIRERIEDIERNPVAGGAPVWSQVMRIQFVL